MARFKLNNNTINLLKSKGQECAKKLAIDAANKLMVEYQRLVKDYYSEYTPNHYKRVYGLSDPVKKLYKNAHGAIYYGGIELLPENLTINTKQQGVEKSIMAFDSFLDGFHGPKFLNISQESNPYKRLLIYRDFLKMNYK